MKRLEKHNAISIVKRHSLTEFTSEDLLEIAVKEGFYYWDTQNLFQELVSEGKLSAYYESIKVDPNKYLHPYSTHNSANKENRFGSKTVAIYTYIAG